MKIFTYSGRILTGKRETCKQKRLDLKFDEQGFLAFKNYLDF